MCEQQGLTEIERDILRSLIRHGNDECGSVQGINLESITGPRSSLSSSDTSKDSAMTAA